MESTATTKNKIELIQSAIQQLIESKQASAADGHLIDNDEDGQLLANLLSQLESLKADGVVNPSEPEAEPNEALLCRISEVETKCKYETETSGSNTVAGAEDVVKELKKLEKQNRVTHWLLSGLILVTVAWQLSEVSLLLKLKDGVTHPFKSLQNMVAGMVKGPRSIKQEAEQALSTNKNGNDTLLDKLPHFELPDMITNGEED